MGSEKRPAHLSILGAGPAGLSVGFYARKRGIPFTIFEAGSRIGGNCVTFQEGDFYFDSGAHRFHDKIPRVTEEVKALLGNDLIRNSAPSQIYYDGKFIDFPLSPLNLLKNLGPFTFTKAGVEVLSGKIQKSHVVGSFESFALHTYGRIIASRFLLNYSEKLWGASSDQLSPYIAGTRMKGLGLKTFLTEAFLGRKAKTQHLDGSFYYPRLGIGMIAESLGESCGRENIRTGARITKISHSSDRILSIEINGNENCDAGEVVSTLPLTLVVRMMDPPLSPEILNVAGQLRFRNLMLVALFLDRDSVGENATMYFPESKYVFTRVYEPKIRSAFLSPPGKTSLISEVPCQADDATWKMNDKDLANLVADQLSEMTGIRKSEVMGSKIIRISHAYPILEKGFEDKVQTIFGCMDHFQNLKIAGRNGQFTYTSIHDMMKSGEEVIQEYG